MFDELLTLEELDASTRQLAGDSRVTITPLGHSRQGRAIEMLSLGDGTRNALIVGVPHPNEPAGAVTIERMIRLLLDDESARRGYRWHFIKAIDPDGLHLNEGWLKTRRLRDYFEHFFRPALDRQPETTFPLDVPECRFTASTPENECWQRAFNLTRPVLHASLHHCDFGGVFYSISRALPDAIPGLQRAAESSGLGLILHDDVMDAEHYAPAISRHPSVPELIAKAKATGVSWAYPWEYGEMSPGHGEALFGTFTLIAEAPIWDAPSLHDSSPSGVTVGEQRSMLDQIGAKAQDVARRHIEGLASAARKPAELECLWALERGLKMIPSSQPVLVAESAEVSIEDGRMLSCREFDLQHTEYALFSLRTYGLVLRLADLVIDRDPGNASALAAKAEATAALSHELEVLERRTQFTQVPLSLLTDFQMQSIFVCADALARAPEPFEAHH